VAAAALAHRWIEEPLGKLGRGERPPQAPSIRA